MTFAEIKTKFQDISGRSDLSDDSLGELINAGQRMLDTLPYEIPESIAEYEFTLDADTDFKEIASLRAPDTVYVTTESGDMTLERKHVTEFRHIVGNSSTLTATYPEMYAFASKRPALAVSNLIMRGLMFHPKSSAARTVKVIGRFGNPKMTQDTDVTFWTLQYPEVLIQAAWYTLEARYRNTQGMADHMNAIRNILTGLDADEAEASDGGGPINPIW